MNEMMLKIITPDRVFYEDSVSAVEFNTTEGEIGILPGHVPMTVIIKPGILVIEKEGQEKVAALHAGFAEILQDGVTILAEIIEWPDEIDEERAVAARERAVERLQRRSSEVDETRAETALLRALARINVLR